MRITNFPEYANDSKYGRQPDILWGTTAPDGDADSPVQWKSARVGSLYVRSDGTDSTLYSKQASADEDADWKEIGLATGGTSVSAQIGIPLHTFYRVSSHNAVEPLATGSLKKTIPIYMSMVREAGSNNLGNIAANGGLLATDSTPTLAFNNGDTDSAFEAVWAASNADPIAIQVPIPLDLDADSNIIFRVIASMGGATDTPALNLDSYFDVGDTKVEDATAALTGTTVAAYEATIAAADVPTGAKTLTIEITPEAHTSDVINLYSAELEYTAAVGPKYATVNGDTDGNRVITWAAADVTPIVTEVFLPSDLDDAEDIVLTLFSKMSDANDTPTIGVASWFDEGDTKVSDTSSALGSSYAAETATIAAADVPTTPHKLTLKLTPGAHNTDSILLSMAWLSYTRL